MIFHFLPFIKQFFLKMEMFTLLYWVCNQSSTDVAFESDPLCSYFVLSYFWWIQMFTITMWKNFQDSRWPLSPRADETSGSRSLLWYHYRKWYVQRNRILVCYIFVLYLGTGAAGKIGINPDRSPVARLRICFLVLSIVTPIELIKRGEQAPAPNHWRPKHPFLSKQNVGWPKVGRSLWQQLKPNKPCFKKFDSFERSSVDTFATLSSLFH